MPLSPCCWKYFICLTAVFVSARSLYWIGILFCNCITRLIYTGQLKKKLSLTLSACRRYTYRTYRGPWEDLAAYVFLYHIFEFYDTLIIFVLSYFCPYIFFIIFSLSYFENLNHILYHIFLNLTLFFMDFKKYGIKYDKDF